MSASPNRLAAVELDEESIGRGSPDIEHERAVAIYDLLEENHFALNDHDSGPYQLRLSIQEKRLVFDIRDEAGGPVVTHILSLTPFRRIVKDYFLVCESYYQMIRTASPSRIEAVDMGRRGIHNEGSRILTERLEGKIDVDFDTARRLFTLICVLHWKG
ncbi:UPF0262 family protein [Microbaculum sp. FT89]|uniref:UPF0262 family protein n=1 Tax=Microbaculum sp. FT89 TaxID=3447298 RepID=UPI003F531183